MADLLFSLPCSKGVGIAEVKAKHVVRTKILNEHAADLEIWPFSSWIQKLG